MKDKYLEQMQKACEALHERIFPAAVMNKFEQEALSDIDKGQNICAIHNIPTMQRLYPNGIWFCSECCQMMFERGLLDGRIVFDMTK